MAIKQLLSILVVIGLAFHILKRCRDVGAGLLERAHPEVLHELCGADVQPLAAKVWHVYRLPQLTVLEAQRLNPASGCEPMIPLET